MVLKKLVSTCSRKLRGNPFFTRLSVHSVALDCFLKIKFLVQLTASLFQDCSCHYHLRWPAPIYWRVGNIFESRFLAGKMKKRRENV